jgi:hypothetical protein
MAGSDLVLSTTASRCPKLYTVTPRNRHCPKLDGADDNDSANTQKLLPTMATLSATMFTPVFGRSIQSVINSPESHRLL